VGSEENPKQVFHRCPRALGNRCRDSPIPRSPDDDRMENWKSKSRIPTFPYSVYLSLKLKMKGESIPPVTLVVQAHLKIGKRLDGYGDNVGVTHSGALQYQADAVERVFCFVVETIGDLPCF
jgi:hypothetical protein